MDERDELNEDLTSGNQPQPFKAGEILRNMDGQFSFLCNYCNTSCDDCLQMMDHINTHFDESNLTEYQTPQPEFVNFTITEVEMEPQCNQKVQEPVNETSTSNLPTDSSVASKPPLAKPETRRCLKRCLDQLEQHGTKVTSTKRNTNDVFKIQNRPTLSVRIVKPNSPSSAIQTFLPKPPISVIQSKPPISVNQSKPPISVIQSKPPISVIQSKPPISVIQPKPPNLVIKAKLPILVAQPKPSILATQPKPSVSVNQPKINRVYGNYEELYKKSHGNITLTSSQDLGKYKKILEKRKEMIIFCPQCNAPPPVKESDPRPHKCKDCGEWFQDHVWYRAHFPVVHRNINKANKIIKCYQCHMEPQIKNESDPRRHKCTFCQQWFPHHLEFKTHFKDVHDKDVDNFSDYEEYTCYVCEKNVRQRDYLFYHVKCHFDKYLAHQCHTCGLRVRSEGALKDHMTVHDDKTYECDLCDKVFTSMRGLRNHRACHATQLEHVCKTCEKGFKLRKYLYRHMALHRDAKLACRFCDATFVWSTGRRAHEKSQHNVL